MKMTELDKQSRRVDRALMQQMDEAKAVHEYRITRPNLYQGNCPGRTNPSARQGHYYIAHNELEAVRKARKEFRNEPLTVQLWKEDVYAGHC